MKSMDDKLAQAIADHAAALKRHDTRAIHYHRERLKELRTKQLRRDLSWRGKAWRAWASVKTIIPPLARIAGTFGMFLIAAAAWCIVMPLDAYASEMAPWQPSAWPIRIIAGIVIFGGAVWIIGRMFRDDRAEPFSREDDWGSQ